MTLLRILRRDQRGATAMEYGLIAALVSIAAVGAIGALGINVTGAFTNANAPVAVAGTVN